MINKEVEVSAEFKSQATKTIISVVVFVFVYLLLFSLSISLMTLCVYTGISMIVNIPGIFSIAVGIGLSSSAFFVLYFLFKFIFKTNKTDRSHLHEITIKDEPKVFEIISDIVQEVGTSFPKKIYLSSEVNASVFYDSSFWSMFFPIEKNLLVGMGLINTVSQEELKAILAHEFGHFSQRSMKVGSYVYNVNHVIHNMLFDNDSFDKIVQDWSNASGFFAIFVVVAVKIVDGIKWILQKMYEFVNKNYLGLSREMEFHADEIAANVTGYMPLKTGLLRLPLADSCYNNILAFYEMNISKNLMSKNIFLEQSFVMEFFAKEDEMKVTNSLPLVTLNDINKYNKSKLVIEDQWSSHPSIEDRIQRLEGKVRIERKDNEDCLASELFMNIIKTQEFITTKLFSEIKYESTPKLNLVEEFKSSFREQFSDNEFPKMFNGYYDIKNHIPFEFDKVVLVEKNLALETLLSDEMINLVRAANSLESDIETIKLISDKTIKLKTFEYDGIKYKRKESSRLLTQLNQQQEELAENIKTNDIKIFNYFLNLENGNSGQGKLMAYYEELFNFDVKYEEYMNVYLEMNNMLEFIQFQTPYERIIDNFRTISNSEIKFKKNIKDLLSNSKLECEVTDEMNENFKTYLSKGWEYFIGKSYIDKNLEMLFTALSDYTYLLSKGYFQIKKELLNYKSFLSKLN